MSSGDMHTESPLPQVIARHHRAAEANIPLKKKLCNFGNWVPRVVSLVATLGLCRVFYKTWGLPLPVDASHRAVGWECVLRKLKKAWKQISLGCALVLSLSVALLQIDLILQNTFGRTTAIATFIFSGAGLVLSIIFRLVIDRPKEGKCPNRWIKASKAFDNLESVEFWSLLALPLSFLVWSVVLCMITVLVLSWATQNGNGNDDDVATLGAKKLISVAFLVTLTLMVIGSGYRAIKFARELC